MLRTRFIVLITVLALALGSLGLVGCSSSDDGTDDATEETEATVEQSDNPIVGTWENADAYYYAGMTFNADGTGVISDIDGEEAEMTWTLEEDYLEVSIDAPDGSETSGGGFTWNEEGSEFSWDMDGTYTKVD